MQSSSSSAKKHNFGHWEEEDQCRALFAVGRVLTADHYELWDSRGSSKNSHVPSSIKSRVNCLNVHLSIYVFYWANATPISFSGFLKLRDTQREYFRVARKICKGFFSRTRYITLKSPLSKGMSHSDLRQLVPSQPEHIPRPYPILRGPSRYLSSMLYKCIWCFVSHSLNWRKGCLRWDFRNFGTYVRNSSPTWVTFCVRVWLTPKQFQANGTSGKNVADSTKKANKNAASNLLPRFDKVCVRKASLTYPKDWNRTHGHIY